MFIFIYPSWRFRVTFYVRPTELDHALHMIKPTLSWSPFGFLYFDLTLLPHKSFVRSWGQLTIILQKQFPFGNLQITLFNKNITFAQGNVLPPMAVTNTEKLWYYANLPVR